MRIFGTMYTRVLNLARHERALHYLCALSFVEGFIFPISPEVMLAPMMLSTRQRAFLYANTSLLFSLLGSLIGYALGHWIFQALHPWLDMLGLLAPIEHAVSALKADMHLNPMRLMFVLFIMALQPIVPMKCITWSAGIVGVPLLPFLICIALGRGKRVWLLAWLIRKFGDRAEIHLRRHAEMIGWLTLLLVAVLVLCWICWR